MSMNTYLYICQDAVAKTHDISILSLTPLSHALDYQAGQYVEVLLRSGDCLLLSIANAPQSDGRIEFHLRHDAAHPLAQVFFNELQTAPTIALRGPFGDSTLAQALPSEEALIFLAGGTGFAPLKALLEEALPQQQRPLFLYWGIRRPEDGYQASLLQQWQKQFEHFAYTLVLSEPTSVQWHAPIGLAHDHVASMHPDMTKLCLFASGPFEMIKAAHNLFTAQGLQKSRFISDMLPKTR